MSRRDLHRAERQWRASPNAWQRPQPTLGGIVFARCGAWIDRHVVGLSLFALVTAYAAGLATGAIIR